MNRERSASFPSMRDILIVHLGGLHITWEVGRENMALHPKRYWFSSREVLDLW